MVMLMEVNDLLNLKDNQTKAFNEKIITTKYEMLGIKIPVLRKIVNKLSYFELLNILEYENTYYEIVLLKALVLGKIKSINELEPYFYNYLDLIDNWALCDTLCSSLKIVKENKPYFLKIITNLINTKKEYYVRVGLVLLLNYYIVEDYLNIIFDLINKTESNYYYVNMARAWLLCECFIKYEKETLNYLKHNSLDTFTINKTISKIKDSTRVNKTTKAYIMLFKKES